MGERCCSLWEGLGWVTLEGTEPNVLSLLVAPAQGNPSE